MVYLADTLSDGKADVPYVVVAALDPAAPPPLGPFLPKGVSALKDDEIVLAEWPDSPLTTKPGRHDHAAPITRRSSTAIFSLDTAKFRLAGTIPMAGPAADPGLTPEFPGVTDKVSIRDWNPPFPFDNKRIKPGDRNERFWDAYRSAPRAYVNSGRRPEALGQPLRQTHFDPPRPIGSCGPAKEQRGV